MKKYEETVNKLSSFVPTIHTILTSKYSIATNEFKKTYRPQMMQNLNVQTDLKK